MRNTNCCEDTMKRKCGAWFACAALTAGMSAGTQPVHAAAPNYATPGLSAEQLARLPGVSFARPLQEMPARNLIVLHLTFPPKRGALSPQQACSAHRHSGPAIIRVTQGAVRLGLEGRPVQIVRAGGTFYEPAQSLQTVAENASSTEPAAAVAVIVVPKGASILSPDKNCGTRPAH